MKAPIDKLFREKLEQYSLEAPAMAWSKIETALPNNNKSFIWLKIAASMLVLLTLSILLWPSKHNTSLMVDTHKPSDKTINSKPNEKVKSNQQTDKLKSNNGNREIKIDSQQEKKADEKPVKVTPAPVTNFSNRGTNLAMNENPAQKTEPIIIEEINTIAIVESQTVSETPTSSAIVKNNQENTVIVLAATDVSKYLKNTSMADATTEEENTSSFRKLLDKAADLKNSDSGFSELRQKKNEILALNFRNDNRERNN